MEHWIVILDKASDASEALLYNYDLYIRMLQHPELNVLHVAAESDDKAVEKAENILKTRSIVLMQERLGNMKLSSMSKAVYDKVVKDTWRYIVYSTVKDCSDNISKAAIHLGVNRKTVYRALHES